MTMTLYLTESNVEEILTMPAAIRAIEDALRALSNGDAINRPRQRVRVPNGVLQVMPAGFSTRGYVGFKYYASFKSATRFWFHLLDATSGELVCIMQANKLGQMRTGAASGVATKYLARENANVVGLIGTGWQAASQLEAICAAREIEIARAYSRDAEHRKNFARMLSARLNVDVRGVDSARDAVRDADILIAATNAREPVLRGEWIKPGAHINAIGANRIDARELDDDAVNRCAFICVDSIEQAKIEARDLVEPIERGRLKWEDVKELSDVVSGKIVGRAQADAITLFKSLGIALEDVAVGAWVYERAREMKIGAEISL
ncbi:MAG: ornithine cyclodeaminase family protein [Chloroflexi bacterium]|nr:ornithine cyclodeaminase family protein [Chloroflexota bacterium]